MCDSNAKQAEANGSISVRSSPCEVEMNLDGWKKGAAGEFDIGPNVKGWRLISPLH